MRDLDFDKFMVYLRQFQTKMQKDFNSDLKRFGISSTHIGVIKLLNEQKMGYSMSELCRILKVDNALMTRNIKELEKNNYVYRNRKNELERKYCICLTDEGKKVANGMSKIVKEKKERFMKVFNKEEQEIILQATNLIAKKFIKIIEEDDKKC